MWNILTIVYYVACVIEYREVDFNHRLDLVLIFKFVLVMQVFILVTRFVHSCA